MNPYSVELILEKLAEEELLEKIARKNIPRVILPESVGSYIYPTVGGIAGLGLGTTAASLLYRPRLGFWTKLALLGGLPLGATIGGALLGRYMGPSMMAKAPHYPLPSGY